MKIRIFAMWLALGCWAFQAQAQDDCSGFYPLKKGTSWELSSYNKKGALASVSAQEIISVENKNGAWEAQVRNKISDDKGKPVSENTFIIRCKDGEVFMDVADILSPEMKESLGNMEMSIKGEALELPSKLSVGQTLPNANAEIKAGTGGVTIMTLRFDISDRKVEAKETLTTPAGKFECFKIVYNLTVKTIGVRTVPAAVWYSPNAGMVKTETYDKKGLVESRTELTKFQRATN